MKKNNFQIQLGDHSIPCKEYLPGGEVKLVVLGVHGFGGDKESSVLRALAGQLEPLGGALVCFDFPCHGESRAPDEMLGVEICRSDLLAMADEVRRRFPDAQKGIFATSFGGYITMLSLDLLNDFSIVLRSPAVTMAESFLTIIPDRESFFEKGSALCGFERKMLLTTAFHDDLKAHTVPLPDRPVLIIHGTKDDIVPFSAVSEMAGQSDFITLCPIEGADHRFKRRGHLESMLRIAVGWFTAGGTL